jgi:acyl transferase domain-containing protein
MTRSRGEPDARAVAVVGLACRLPGAESADALWTLLRDGVDATRETPSDRYDVDALYSAHPAPGRVGARRAGYVDGVAEFDAEFFGMSSAEAVELDPQQRLLLMTAWEALEDAGQRPDLLAGSRAGVFVGNAHGHYQELQFRRGLDAVTPSMFGNYRSLLPSRLSYLFDLRGPSVLVDTACSSSLVAVHLAAQSLRAYESPLALAAGVNLKLLPDGEVLMTQNGTLARDGRSKFGAADADGFAPSDAVGVVVLKRLADAVADGDRVRAVLAGSAVGNDGRTSGALLTPSVAGQTEVLRRAYEDAGVAPADVDLVEAHGVGSPEFDPVELAGLGEVLGEGRPVDRPCLVGSVKTNVGHAEAAGGMAGLLKAVLCLEHGQVPASLHFDTPNPAVPWDTLPLTVPTRLQGLADHGRPAVAGVSGQGASSLNAHLVLRQGDTVARDLPSPSPGAEGEAHVLALSARSAEALDLLVRAYADHLGPEGRGRRDTLRDVCFTAATRRQHHAHRRAVVGRSHDALVDALDGAGDDAALVGDARTDLLRSVVKRYESGEQVDWEALFPDAGRVVALPHHPWRTRRYWLGEQGGPADPEEDRDQRGDDVDVLLRRYAYATSSETAAYTDDDTLADLGIDSLARVQMLVELSQTLGHEIDAAEFAELRTVGAFRTWFRALSLQAA